MADTGYLHIRPPGCDHDGGSPIGNGGTVEHTKRVGHHRTAQHLVNVNLFLEVGEVVPGTVCVGLYGYHRQRLPREPVALHVHSGDHRTQGGHGQAEGDLGVRQDTTKYLGSDGCGLVRHLLASDGEDVGVMAGPNGEGRGLQQRGTAPRGVLHPPGRNTR